MRKYLKYIFLTAAIVWMCIIFWFSAQPAVQSTEMSMAFGSKICNIFVPGYSELDTQKQYELAQSIEFPVRKSAHASEYAFLAILWCGYFVCTLKKEKMRRFYLIFSWFVATAYATTDEFHQLFVQGRSGQLRDVLIDSVGAAVGVLIVYMFLKNKCADSTENSGRSESHNDTGEHDTKHNSDNT